jgi:protein O-GlcNAc transferase
VGFFNLRNKYINVPEALCTQVFGNGSSDWFKGKTAETLAKKMKDPSPDAMKALAALFNQGRYAEGEVIAQKMIKQFSNHGFGWKVLGAIFHMQGRLEEALQAKEQATLLMPDDAEGHNNLGRSLQELGSFSDAENSLRRALALKPDYPAAYNNLGLTLQQMGRLNEAEATLRRALALNPDYAEAHNNLGVTLEKKGQLADAEFSYRQALEIRPDYAEAHNNLGSTLQHLGRLKEAEASCRRALQIKPDFAETYSNLGITLQHLGRLKEAEASCRRALQIKPDFPEAHSNLGNILRDFCRLDEAEVCYRKALELNADLQDAFGNLLFILNYHPDKLGKEIFQAYQAYDAQFGLPYQPEWQIHGNSRETRRRLKVGYVSPDFKKHSVRHFLEPLLAQHDKHVVEVYAYAQLVNEDEVTARYRGYVDHWVPTRGMSDETLAERIRADCIDILVDLAGHTDQSRLSVFAHKPTPVSVSWLGFGYTTGLTAVDYYLTDETSAPPGSEGLFSETPYRLATPSYPYRPAEGMGSVSSLPAKAFGHVTFGTLTRAVRINHRTIQVWSEILKLVAGSRLVIDSSNFADANVQEGLAAKFAVHGIGRERLEIGFHSPPWDVLRSLDIGLDCFPHNSGTTLFETLYMGIPFITLAGRPSVGRLGSSILVGVGHPEWIAHTEEDYIEIAVTLAADLPKLSTLRGGLRQEMQASALMDEQGFARKVEAAYKKMFGLWSERNQ